MGKEEELLKPIGGPQACPACGQDNPSGKQLPKECIWCKGKGLKRKK